MPASPPGDEPRDDPSRGRRSRYRQPDEFDGYDLPSAGGYRGSRRSEDRDAYEAGPGHDGPDHPATPYDGPGPYDGPTPYDGPGPYDAPNPYEAPEAPRRPSPYGAEPGWPSAGGYPPGGALDEPTALTPRVVPGDPATSGWSQGGGEPPAGYEPADGWPQPSREPATAGWPQAGQEPGDGEADGVPDPVSRPASLAAAGCAVLVAGALAVGAMLPPGAYALVVFAVQVSLVLAWTVVTRPPAPRVVAGVGLAAAAVADLGAVLHDPPSLAPLAYALAGAFVAGMIGQLTRGAGRQGVTESLGGTLAVAVGAVSLAAAVVSARQALGIPSIMACFVAAGTALAVARLTDLVAAAPRVASAVPRGVPGLVLGALLGAGAGAGAGVAGGLGGAAAAGAALVSALVAVIVDLTIGYAEAGRRIAGGPTSRSLPRQALGPLYAVALAAPTAFAVSALVLANHG